MEISIIIPAYNEEKNIRLGALDKVARYLETKKMQWEVIVIDDGSTDMTKRLLSDFAKKNKGFRVMYEPHRGKAGTVIAGIFEAKGEIILFSDLDQATPLDQLEKLLPYFQKDYDVVIGSRSNTREGAPLTRILMARGFMFLRSTILGLKGITDTQCGFKAFRSESAKHIFGQLKLYNQSKLAHGAKVTAGFDIETLFIAKRMGYSIKEVPVEWHYVETRRVNPITDSLEGFMDILRIRMNAFQGVYTVSNDSLKKNKHSSMPVE